MRDYTILSVVVDCLLLSSFSGLDAKERGIKMVSE